MRWILPFAVLLASTSTHAARPTGEEPIVGGPCEGCEFVFVGMPESFASDVAIAAGEEPGQPLRIEGRVVDPSGSPAAGIVVYAYHTDAEGNYPPIEGPARRHGRLRAWAASDDDGRFVFRTIRPASYPDTRIEQHVHLHVIEPGRCTYWIDAVVFGDDPYFDPAVHGGRGRGGSGVTSPQRDADGTWVVERDIRLGQNVPGYPGRR